MLPTVAADRIPDGFESQFFAIITRPKTGSGPGDVISLRRGSRNTQLGANW
jgi:hypothetical protein